MQIQIGSIGSLVIGLLVYLLLGDYQVFSWADPWLYIYMLFWPFVLLFKFLFWALIIAVVIFVIAYSADRVKG